MNEIDLYRDERPDAAPYDPGTKAMARERLAAAGRGRTARRRGPYLMVAAGGLALAAAVTVVQALPATPPAQSAQPAQSARAARTTEPALTLMSAAEVLDRAAQAVDEELTPRDDQYVVVRSQTMYGSYALGKKEERWLYRSKRTIWLRASQPEQGPYGVLRIEMLEPRAFPGWPIPRKAFAEAAAGPELRALVDCDGGTIPERLRTDYVSLKRLPADAEGMRAHLYAQEGEPDDADRAAFQRAGDLLRETYLPPAQRKALYQAVATIPGVSVTGTAEDAAGRTGVSIGREYGGQRDELIFDRESFALLGERSVVTDAGRAGAPEGSLLASTAQLEVSVSDTAPEPDEPPCGAKG
ncbi:CU044_5270 family protein [Nonomuraea sp. NPDC050328]|uniref:CU044_5270 family protein n=1 Tax=Nonomuraea sp. NPDC050328 TaxID=3364361 RepID=UPI00378EA325